MNTSPLSIDEFAATVLAVPPLARRADLTLDPEQNRRLIRHMEAGGHRILLYGGNANLYHCAVSEFGALLDLLAESSAPTTRVIPAVGPDFGKLMDQARLLRGSAYRTAMVLPMQGFSSPEGVEEGISRFVDLAGIPVTMYLKSEYTLPVDAVGRLVDQGKVLAVKYAVVRDDPLQDAYLDALVQRLGASRIVSGMGERPVLAHLSRFKLASFTTGSGCIAPRACLRLLAALKKGDTAQAQALHARFMPLEDLRESISLIRVLHDAVTLTGIADMGPQLPLLSASPADRMAEIRAQANALLDYERSL